MTVFSDVYFDKTDSLSHSILSGRGLKGLMQPNHSYTMKVVFPQTTIQHKHNPITLAQVLPLHMGQTYLTKKVL